MSVREKGEGAMIMRLEIDSDIDSDSGSRPSDSNSDSDRWWKWNVECGMWKIISLTRGTLLNVWCKEQCTRGEIRHDSDRLLCAIFVHVKCLKNFSNSTFTF